MLSYPTSTLSQLGQPVWYRYNSQSGRSVPHEYNNISAGLGWPVWIGFLSTWVVRMVRVNSIERCAFHVSRLRHYISNDDKVFPRCKVRAYYDFGDAKDNEWLVDEILAHQWNGNKVLFLVQWNLGDTTWEPYSECKDLEALDRYLELLGIDENDWKKLLRKSSTTDKQTSRSSNANKPARRVARKRN